MSFLKILFQIPSLFLFWHILALKFEIFIQIPIEDCVIYLLPGNKTVKFFQILNRILWPSPHKKQ